MKDKVLDREGDGIKLTQIEDLAFHEGLPLRRADREGYLKWAVRALGFASSPVIDETQIQTHMCYAEFNDSIDGTAERDAQESG